MPPRDAETARFECNARARFTRQVLHSSLRVDSTNCCIWVLLGRLRPRVPFHENDFRCLLIGTLSVMANNLRDDGKAFRSRGENAKGYTKSTRSLHELHYVKYDTMRSRVLERKSIELLTDQLRKYINTIFIHY